MEAVVNFLEAILTQFFAPIVQRLDLLVGIGHATRLNTEKILAEQRALRAFVARALLPVPGPVRARQVGRDEMSLVYVAELPTSLPQAKDVVKRKLTITNADTGEELSPAQEFGVETEPVNPDEPEGPRQFATKESGEFAVTQGTNVRLSLYHVDDAGNDSSPSTQDFPAKDTIPPDAPGPFGGIKLVREE
jgi:hypothetical protein